ncbi:MAG TPA: hypothetical protein ENJ08_02335 [Gammaproteobacteria bacterium]|nr:hypothetical protein [Gammaproteobacteria bacterium]
MKYIILFRTLKRCPFIAALSLAIFFIGNANATEQKQTDKTPPAAIEFIQILFKNGKRIEKGCSTEVYDGATLTDKLAELISPEGDKNHVVITYNCIDDKRETKDTMELVPVWNCSITGQNIWKNTTEGRGC